MNSKAFFWGFSRWKQDWIEPFFSDSDICFCADFDTFSHQGINRDSKIYIWGKNIPDGLKQIAKEKKIPIYRVEDGFVRSVSLGLKLSQFYSIVIDRRGIYFDATTESDLEHILSSYDFDNSLLKRADWTKKYLVKNKLSKYNLFENKNIALPGKKKHQKTIMVVGQVEGDASLMYGADDMKNVELLQRARGDYPDAYLIYKPHPDVLTGKRKGHVDPEVALEYADHIEEKVSVDSVLEVVDTVAVMTSLVGMEALLREKKVICYGMPFYAGWGLTVDKVSCERRKRKLTLSELIAGAYILYPRYIHPRTLQACEIEELLEALKDEKESYHASWIYRAKTHLQNFYRIKTYAIMRHLGMR